MHFLFCHLVKQGHHEPGARAADGMAEGDAAAVHVDDVAVPAQFPLTREVLRREGFVDLDKLDVAQLVPPFSAFFVAGTGPMPIYAGSTPATA